MGYSGSMDFMFNYESIQHKYFLDNLEECDAGKYHLSLDFSWTKETALIVILCDHELPLKK